MTYTVVIVVLWAAFWGFIGAMVGSGRGRGGLGFLLGALFSVLGVILVGLIAPTPEKLAERDAAQARALRDALKAGGQAGPEAMGVDTAITPAVRQQLLAEAIRRDPSFAEASDPVTLGRLAETMVSLERDHQLKAELRQLKARKAANAAESGAHEWPGALIEVALDPIQSSHWSTILDGAHVENRWSILKMETDQAGQLKLTVSVWGQPVAELPALKMAGHPDLVEAVGGGVNVGVAKLDTRSVPAATLFLGAGYSQRPTAPWE